MPYKEKERKKKKKDYTFRKGKSVRLILPLLAAIYFLLKLTPFQKRGKAFWHSCFRWNFNDSSRVNHFSEGRQNDFYIVVSPTSVYVYLEFNYRYLQYVGEKSLDSSSVS